MSNDDAHYDPISAAFEQKMLLWMNEYLYEQGLIPEKHYCAMIRQIMCMKPVKRGGKSSDKKG